MKVAALCASVWLLLFTAALADTARAEDSKFYAGVYGGYTFPEELGTRSTSHTGIYGLKAGFIPPPHITWFNLEGELFVTDHRIGAEGTTPSATLWIMTVALNWILRYPGERIQPYVGVGPSVVWAQSAQLGNSDLALGVNFIVGSRFALTRTLFLFGEYKHNRASIFSGLDYRLHAGVGGIGLHF